MKTNGLARIITVLGFVFVCASVEKVTASSIRMVELVVTTTTTTMVPEGTTVVEPYWEIEADRQMAVQLSSESSVAECETALRAGYGTCTLFLPPCAALSISHQRKVPFRLQVYPARCHRSNELYWSVTGGGREVRRIEVHDGSRTVQ